jgi:hypothetical protein
MARDFPAGKEHGSKVRAPFKALAAKKVNKTVKIKMKKRIFEPRGIDSKKSKESKESIPPAYVAWRAGTTTLFLLFS